MVRVIPWCLAVWVGSVAMARDWPGKVPSDADRGEELYARHCVSCHGAKAAGDGAAATAMASPMQDFSKGWGKRDVDDLVRVVLRGKGIMPAFEVSFDREDAVRVVDWMGRVGLQRPKPKPKPKPKGGDDDDAEQVEGDGAEGDEIEEARP